MRRLKTKQIIAWGVTILFGGILISTAISAMESSMDLFSKLVVVILMSVITGLLFRKAINIKD